MNIRRSKYILALAAMLFLGSCGGGKTVEVSTAAAPETPAPQISTNTASSETETPAETSSDTKDTTARSNIITGTVHIEEEPSEFVFSGRPAEELIYDTVRRDNGTDTPYEYQKADGDVTILGTNLVYVGENFTYDCVFMSTDYAPETKWNVKGDCGEITQDGLFTALAEGVCGIVFEDISDGTSSELTVHCIKSGTDVGFIPMVNNIPIANKTYPLPSVYAPGLIAEVSAAADELMAAAKAEGLSLTIISGFRSYQRQEELYKHWCSLYGYGGNLVSARPGFSEHQLGLAIDFNLTEYALANTAEGRWLKAHCAEYGFILRYPSFDSQQYTGYNFEPWHVRYLGRELAEKVTASELTLEQVLGIDSVYR